MYLKKVNILKSKIINTTEVSGQHMIVFKNIQKKQSSAMASAQLDWAQQGQWVWEEQTSWVGTVTKPVAGFWGGCGSERGGKAGVQGGPGYGQGGSPARSEDWDESRRTAPSFSAVASQTPEYHLQHPAPHPTHFYKVGRKINRAS